MVYGDSLMASPCFIALLYVYRKWWIWFRLEMDLYPLFDICANFQFTDLSFEYMDLLDKYRTKRNIATSVPSENTHTLNRSFNFCIFALSSTLSRSSYSLIRASCIIDMQEGTWSRCIIASTSWWSIRGAPKSLPDRMDSFCIISSSVTGLKLFPSLIVYQKASGHVARKIWLALASKRLGYSNERYPG